MTQDEANIKVFVADLARVLYLGQLLKYNLQALKADVICGPAMKVAANNTINSLNRIVNEVKYALPDDGQRDLITKDLNKEQLLDLSLLIDHLHNSANIGEILELITNAPIEFV